MTNNSTLNRRDTKLPSDDELYKLSMPALKSLIHKERRDDEVERLEEICAQKSAWNKTFTFCSLIIVTLILNSFIWDYWQ